MAQALAGCCPVRRARPGDNVSLAVSKAFTSEETPDVLPPVREPPRLAPGELRYVTPEGHAALRGELERLRAGAAPAPDGADERSRRILLLERTLAALTVLGPEGVPEGEIGFGAWVSLEDEGGGLATWRIVGPDEADARRGTVSALSPLGRALLGRVAGETVEVQRPGGAREYTIREVRRRPPGVR
jgi:transcription elongation factor GreB